jgi:hypothetical protein
MSRVADLYREASRVRRTEGFARLLRRGLAFALNGLYEYRAYYLSEYNLENTRSLDEADFMPRVSDLSFRVVTGNREADELEAAGYRFRSYVTRFDPRKALDNGAVAFCLFTGRELAAMGWGAMTQQAFASLNERPIKISFSKGDAFTGAIWTSPKYRRMGLRTYRTFKLRQFLLEQGAAMTRGAIAKENVAAWTGLAKIHSTIYGEARYLRVLWWKSWKERPLSAPGREAIGQEDEPRS